MDIKITRRAALQRTLTLAGVAALAPVLPEWIAPVLHGQQPVEDAFAKTKAQMATAPVETMQLGDGMTLLSGPGGNVVVLHGRDGKVLVDCFVEPAWPKLLAALDTLGNSPVTTVIDTHWHFDHADNNGQLRKRGAAVLAHDNTTARMKASHEILGMKIPPSPPEALPTRTFKDRHSLEANGERVDMAHVLPAHTDTDVYVRFEKANVLHLGDLFFNGRYPFIDVSTGGRIDGMIAAAGLALEMSDARTRIVPGHGPLADRTALTAYRDMLVTVADRVRKLKSAGRTLAEVIAAKPTADLDAVWGKGMTPEMFLTTVYGTL